MSSKQTWQRRALATLTKVAEEEGLGLIEGLSEREDGTLVFSHEVLTDAESERVHSVLADTVDWLSRRYDRLGGAAAEANVEEVVLDPEEEPLDNDPADLDPEADESDDEASEEDDDFEGFDWGAVLAPDESDESEDEASEEDVEGEADEPPAPVSALDRLGVHLQD